MSFGEFYQATSGLGDALVEAMNRREATKLLEQQLTLATQGQQQPLGALGSPAGAAQPASALAPLGASRAPTFAATDGDIGGYLSQVRARESGGNDLAANPTSSAKGRYQFTDQTWAGVAKRHPDLGLQPGGWRDPGQQERAMQAFTADNAKALTAAGLPINPQNLYGSHFLGEAGGPQFIRNALRTPDAPAVQFVSPGAASANRSVFYNKDGSPKTAGQVYSWLGGSMAPAGAPQRRAPSPNVDVAENEDQVQALERRQVPQPIITPRMTVADASPDAPAPGAMPAGFRPPAAQSQEFTPGTEASPALSSGQSRGGGTLMSPAAAQRLSPAQADNLRAMLRNPLTQGAAAKIIEGLNKPDEFSFQVVGDQLVRTSKSGRAEVVPNITKPPTFSVVKGSDGNDYILNPQTGQLTRALQGKDKQWTDLTSPEERAAVRIPEGYDGPVQRGPDGEIRLPGKPATAVNIDQKGETAFATTANTGIAKRFQALSEEGDSARTDIALIGQLKNLSDQIGTGGLAAVKGYLAEKGVKLGDNVGPIEAYGSLIDKLTPAQRIPGTGATSDFDARMFKGSLPRLINTPEGNALIANTLEALAQDKIARAQIADKALTGELKPADAINQLRALPPPNLVFKSGLEELRKSGKLGPDASAQSGAQSTAAGQPRPPQTVQPVRVATPEEARRLRSGTPIILPDGRTGVVP